MNSPEDFQGGFLFSGPRALGKVCCDCQRRELLRDIRRHMEENIGALAGTRLYKEPVPDEES